MIAKKYTIRQPIEDLALWLSMHEALRQVKPGYLVNLEFLASDPNNANIDGEQMWVRVDDCSNNELWTGTLMISPIADTGVNIGDAIEFNPFDVIGVAKPLAEKSGPAVVDIEEVMREAPTS